MELEKCLNTDFSGTFFDLEPKVDERAELVKMISSNYFIERCVNIHPDLHNKELTDSYRAAFAENTSLLKYATLVDKLDRVSAVAETAGTVLGPGLGYAVRFGFRLVEKAVKIPFLVKYAKSITDTPSMLNFFTLCANEAVSLIVPYGDIINVANLYQSITKKKIRQDAEKKFIDTMVVSYGNTK